MSVLDVWLVKWAQLSAQSSVRVHQIYHVKMTTNTQLASVASNINK